MRWQMRELPAAKTYLVDPLRSGSKWPRFRIRVAHAPKQQVRFFEDLLVDKIEKSIKLLKKRSVKKVQEQFKMVKDIDRVRNDERKGGRSQCNVITSADAPLSRGLAKQGAWLGVKQQA